MQAAIPRILVVGGNGFLGSAVCKAALARGMQVTSISSSGSPFKTPKGHSPAWVSKVDWQAADALKPATYSHLLPSVTAVVHTLGTLLEDTRYKKALSEGNIAALAGIVASSVLGNGASSNPLASGEGRPDSYETLNRDAALSICEAFVSSKPTVPLDGPRPFVYVSAEDIFRPFIPARYIETKREAELHISQRMAGSTDHRAVFIRPSLIYHPHFRPLTSPIAAMLDLSATIHRKAPPSLPTPSSFLRSLASTFPSSPAPQPPVSTSPLDSVANALTIPPIHVDHVAEAICVAADSQRTDVQGVVGVAEMRELIGWSQKGQAQADVHV
ncbi:NAD(P)-binding protein [Fomitopsis serialis]|uniref:NAD(P)-binding protein n=1 Tax=Fomitopsis serialis TaxID=139415 RepID=UPI002007978C|nr:NAD(P)-binding protein [Neoantrodia serialis]KAH9935003.1 NAD(P)-binding protein [Neoantrodia serialis]